MTIEERLEKLELDLSRAKRRHRRTLVGLAVCATVVFLAAFIAPVDKVQVTDQVRTRMLSVVDKDGTARAMLAVDKEGPRLLLFDENGRERAMLVASNDISGLSLRDDNGKMRAMLAASKHISGLTLFDEKGESVWSAPH